MTRQPRYAGAIEYTTDYANDIKKDEAVTVGMEWEEVERAFARPADAAD